MSEYDKYPRGSEWNKWDLHVHSSASFHWNGGKRLFEMSLNEKATALQSMYDAIVKSEPVAFAIMDYWTFDGYLEFRRFVSDNKLELDKAVFPGMEVRIEAPVNYRLNLQVILSDSLSDQQLQDFKSQLLIRAINRKLSNEALASFAKTLDESKARIHGYDSPESLTKVQLLELGSMTAEITKESLEEAMKTVPRTMAFVIMPWDTSDGIKKLDWQKHPHADSYFMQMAHIFESRDHDMVDLFTGVKTDANRKIFANFQKTIGGKPKPVICGSDAHRFADYGAFPGQKATWIKANPTFEGLKQIVFEPLDRVRVQQENPAKKLPYLILNKMAFLDSAGMSRFGKTHIHLNADLNVIIGGKSSGKSLLLYHIAKTVDPGQVEEKMNTLSEAGYDFEQHPNFDFEVVWGDGIRMRLKEDRESKNRRITYIPQMYINHLAEEKGEQHLRDLVESILGQNDEYRYFLEEVHVRMREKNAEVSESINDLFLLRDTHAQLVKEIKDIGEPKAIAEQIKVTQEKIDKLRRSSGFTKEENDTYEALTKVRDFHHRQSGRYQGVLEALNAFAANATDAFISSAMSQLRQAKDEVVQYHSGDKLIDRLLRGLAQRKEELLTRFGQEYARPDIQLRASVEQKVAKHTEAMGAAKRRLEPYLAKVKNQKFLKELQVVLEKERGKLTKIEEREKKRSEIVDKGKAARKRLLDAYTELHAAYQSISAKLAESPFNKVGVDLQLEARVVFDSDRFAESFSFLFDRRSNFGTLFGSFFVNNQYVYDSDVHNANVTTIFDAISKGEQPNLRFRGEYTSRDAAFKLFDDYFGLKYSLTQRGDNILRMSPGKRGLVLLELILHLSNAEDPILIDQPEDNLDNRTIYNELNQFVKDKKVQRQIIFVTHNANLVVATDAENVLVANQSGQDQGKDNREFTFEYVSGGLECTFRDPNASGILYQMGAREHTCDILEGGRDAFEKREKKYGFLK
jgi:hypothetical protein